MGGGRCICYAAEWYGCQCRGCRSSFPDEDDGHVKANRTTRDCCRMVPFASWIWLLALFGDINTQQSFEQLTPRAVAVVVDPIQSVKGKVVIDAFRLINPQSLMLGQEPRQSTSHLGHLNKPSIQALIHGLDRHYYSIAISYRKTALEENMLMNLHKHVWTEGLQMDDFRVEGGRNNERLKELVGLADGYEKRVKEETEL